MKYWKNAAEMDILKKRYKQITSNGSSLLSFNCNMPHSFTQDNSTGIYLYYENGIKYSLPLLLMLRLKKYFRENNFSYDDLYICKWYLSLSDEDFEQVSITLDRGFEQEPKSVE